MIIFINGSINSGKTTIGRILHEKIPKSAHIEKKEYYLNQQAFKHETPFGLNTIESLARNFVMAGMSVIISCPVTEDEYRTLKNKLSDIEVPMYVFTLTPRLEVVTKNRGRRILSPNEVDQIKVSYSQRVQATSYGRIIDNSDQTPEETAEIIMECL